MGQNDGEGERPMALHDQDGLGHPVPYHHHVPRLRPELRNRQHHQRMPL